MIIHLGGMDATLKSSICSKLQFLLNCNIKHFDKPKNLEDGKLEYFNFLKNNNFLKNDIICDRFHDGEHIYAPIYRGYESNYLQEFEKELKNVPYLFINTTSNIDIIKQRISIRGEDFVLPKDFKLVLQKFDEYLFKQSMPYIKLDTSNCDFEEYLSKILLASKIIKLMFNYVVNNNLQCDYYGNIEAKYFVVSNKQNIKQTLLEKGIYYDSWIINSENKALINYQYSLLNLLHNNDNKLIILEE